MDMIFQNDEETTVSMYHLPSLQLSSHSEPTVSILNLEILKKKTFAFLKVKYDMGTET